ncbi:MAG: AAA family ATPase [Chitinophagales bacterium]|nr:AAA family ATPase [Chitinophagales bacterium]
MNIERLTDYWIKYKEYFELPEPENDEKYKWTVLAQVFEKWDWKAPNKVEMFKNTFEIQGNQNLWVSRDYFPIKHTNWMFEVFPNETIEAFNNLFDETTPILDRVKKFIGFYHEKLPLLKALVPDKKINYHSHGDMRATALYLYLQNPNKYYLFKFTMVKDFLLNIGEQSIKMGKNENLELFFNYSDKVLDFIKSDTEFLSKYNEFTHEQNKYKDESLHLLTQDFIYFISKSNKINLQSNNNTNMSIVEDIFEGYKLFLSKTNYAPKSQEIFLDVAKTYFKVDWKKEFNSEFKSTNLTKKNIYELWEYCKSKKNRFKGDYNFIQFLETYFHLTHNLNSILYGAPGTGKTFNTKKLAVEIITGLEFNDSDSDRKDILRYYNDLNTKGYIQFTTFHQSMSYEEFVEGIKPENNNGKVIYEIKDGIFKSICTEAQTRKSISFEDAYLNLIEELKHIDLLDLKTPSGNTFSISLNRNNNLSLHTGEDRGKQGTLTKENILKQISGEKKFIGWEGYFLGVINYLKSEHNYNGSLSQDYGKYVLIVDEINRGNVSAIFGELITLIEEDKRKGNMEEIIVKLPYSNSDFSVPSNVYIIGTMNTADRSVEALDTALRRRFSFIEMPPIPEKLSTIIEEDLEINLSKLLFKINQRLEILINKDHQIGHAYFMGINSTKDLKLVFKNNIIPLLEEYFFGDIGKICLVLGDNFMELVYNKSSEIKQALAISKVYKEIDFVLDKQVFKVKNIDYLEAKDFISIYQDPNIEED